MSKRCTFSSTFFFGVEIEIVTEGKVEENGGGFLFLKDANQLLLFHFALKTNNNTSIIFPPDLNLLPKKVVLLAEIRAIN